MTNSDVDNLLSSIFINMKCSILEFEISHSRLHIGLWDEMYHKKYYDIIFLNTQYYSGPPRWKGSNLQVSDADTFLQFVEGKNIFPDPIDIFAEEFRLYTIQSQNRVIVHIVASSFSVKVFEVE